MAIAAAVVVLFVSAGEATAQGTSANRPNFGPYWRQQLTPYLDLARGGTPAINYFLGTVTEQNRRANAFAFGNALQELEQQNLATARQEKVIEPIAQGARVTFGNLGPYYGNTLGYYGDNGVKFGPVQPPRIGEPPQRLHR
jgi:hypothetical protein